MHIVTHNLHQRSANYQLKVGHYLGGDKRGGGSMQTMTKSDEGGGGSKIDVRQMTYFLNGP